MAKALENVIKSRWDIVLNAINELDIAISEAEVDLKTIPSCLILAQRLNNYFDFIEAEYKIPNKVMSKEEFREKKDKRDALYKKLHEIFDKVTNDEMISYIKTFLDDRVLKYKLFVQNIEKSTKDDIIKTFELRDEIKLLYDELDIWSGRWAERGERIESCDIRDKFCQEIGGYDVILRKYIIDNKDKFEFLPKEAKKHLILKPDGSKRFDFWWWYF